MILFALASACYMSVSYVYRAFMCWPWLMLLWQATGYFCYFLSSRTRMPQGWVSRDGYTDKSLSMVQYHNHIMNAKNMSFCVQGGLETIVERCIFIFHFIILEAKATQKDKWLYYISSSNLDKVQVRRLTSSFLWLQTADLHFEDDVKPVIVPESAFSNQLCLN